MADLTLDVEARGTEQAAAGMDKVASSTAKAGATWDRLKQKLGSGEVLRNAAASAALLASGAGNTTDKIAALGGALASIPGPVGLVASAVAVGATALGVFGKQAEAAERRAAELAATLANLGKERGAAQGALAARITGAALALGPAASRFGAAGGTAAGLSAAQGLVPGNAAGALAIGTQLAEGGLSDAQRQVAEATLADVKAAGYELSKEVVARVIEGIKYEAEAFAGTGSAGDVREKQANRLGRFLDAVGADSSNRSALSNAGNAAFLSQAGQNNQAAIARAVAPAIADAEAQVRDVYGAGGAVATDALRVTTDKNASATAELTAAIVELTGKINAAGGGTAPAAQTDSAWVDAIFKAGAARSTP